MAAPIARDLLKTTADFLQSRGSRSSRLDADLLLCQVLGLSRTQLYMDLMRPLTTAEVDGYRALVKRRAKLEPIAYIAGTKGFWKHDFAVDKRVLIPRPETERIVEEAAKALAARKEEPLRIVDVGTGSGCIACSLAAEFPQATVVAIDASADALEVAAANATTLGLRDRVKLVRGDLLAPLLARGSKADLIVSNPPYIGTGERERMDEDVKLHEPELALFAGRDGLDLIRRLVVEAAQLLEPEGYLFVEHGDLQGPATRALAEAAGLEQVATLKDYSHLDRVLVARKPPAA
jgi:release factor glutamine methyltransferase